MNSPKNPRLPCLHGSHIHRGCRPLRLQARHWLLGPNSLLGLLCRQMCYDRAALTSRPSVPRPWHPGDFSKLTWPASQRNLPRGWEELCVEFWENPCHTCPVPVGKLGFPLIDWCPSGHADPLQRAATPPSGGAGISWVVTKREKQNWCPKPGRNQAA